ncbi:sigma 54-interacting transcriptional regulator [Aquimarina sp. U1-2]|uniref:sigma-54-dependent Fis family transcriptional regulator n=1 Tax=Aquimarina sp. U1-2 TaxID=2823141 RepID=UPI001AECB389|nr:sigma 54-interacting transcriptional regulator [Aquimarina sp. U1-2]MBP2831841.1 sigma 54-interacting transcriptional regulator [Aquimarina sp. U1-2]
MSANQQNSTSSKKKNNTFDDALLDISLSLANSKDRGQLYKNIYAKIKPLLGFDEMGLFVIDEDQDIFWELLEVNVTSKLQDELAKKELLGPWPYRGRHKKAWIYTDKVTFFDMEEQARIYPNPQWKFILDAGLTKMIAGPLMFQGKRVGLLCFTSKNNNFFSSANIPVFEQIASVIAASVSNILAFEQVKKRERDKALLLSISQEVSKIHGLADFLRFIMQDIKPIFGFYDVGIFLLTEDEQHHYNLAGVHSDFSKSRWNDAILKSSQKLMLHAGSPVAYTMKQLQTIEGPLQQNFQNLIEQFPYYDQFQLNDFKETRYQDCLVHDLKIGGKQFGLFCINSLEKEFFKEAQFSLFKNITEQLSVSLSNILTNNSLRKREEEKSLQVNLVNALNRPSGWNTKLLHLVQHLQAYIDCSIIVFAFQPDNRIDFCYAFERIGAEEYRQFDYQEFLDFVALTEDEYLLQYEENEKTFLENDASFQKTKKKNRFFKKTSEKFQARSRLSTSLQLSLPGHYRISFLSRETAGYSNQDQRLLEEIILTLQLSLDKLLAFEQIEKLNAKLQLEKQYLEEEVEKTFNFGEIIGESDTMKKVYEQIAHVAPLDSSVFIQGETGTGKELIARAIHKNSKRKDNILVKVNCAAIPKDLVESELFGHERGAFTGALKTRVGKFELANNGTIFLDEIGELPLDLQAKLLRVLQEKEIERLGSNQTQQLNFRLITATNRNLQQAVVEGTFRSDLFYRIFIYPIYLPALRERDGDVITIAQHYAHKFANKSGLNFFGFSEAAKERMRSHEWPGNVRELENILQQELVKNRKSELEMLSLVVNTEMLQMGKYKNKLNELFNLPEDFTLSDIDQSKQELEKHLLEQVLERTKWRVSGRHGAAALLDVKAVTLEYRIKKLGLGRK